jgi:hypothetical protein
MEIPNGFHLTYKLMVKPFLNCIFCLLIIGACNSPSNRNLSRKLADTSELSYDSLQMPQDHDTMGREFAKQQLIELLNGKGQPFTWDTLIKNSTTAIAMAEPLLFDIFGKDLILSERPYEVYLIDGYWYLSGTIPKGWKGGGFEIIMSAKDGKIIRLTHYK